MRLGEVDFSELKKNEATHCFFPRKINLGEDGATAPPATV